MLDHKKTIKAARAFLLTGFLGVICWYFFFLTLAALL